MKKSYIYDILMQSKAQINLAQRVFLIVSNNQSLALNSAKKIRDMRKNIDDGDFCVEEKKTPISVQCRKLPKAQYDSELEKSIDSSTTNSTVAL